MGGEGWRLGCYQCEGVVVVVVGRGRAGRFKKTKNKKSNLQRTRSKLAEKCFSLSVLEEFKNGSSTQNVSTLMGKKSRMMANGECRTGGLSFVFFHLIVFPLPPKLVMQVSFLKSASVWILLPWRWGDEQQCVYMCAYSSSFSSSPASLYSFFCRSVPLLNLASHDPRLAGPLLVWKRQGKSQMAE